MKEISARKKIFCDFFENVDKHISIVYNKYNSI